MTRTSPPFVLFVAAAGPELGFGHLIRAAVLADALGAARQLVLRGPEAAVDAAIRFGWTVHRGTDLVGHLLPDLVVVDDPSSAETAKWVRRARRARVPVATIHDGRSERSAADLVIDGSVTARQMDRRMRVSGPTFAIIAPQIAEARVSPRAKDVHRVLVALGGGVHVRRLGAAVASAIAAAVPGARIDVAAGFVSAEALVPLPAGCRWVHAPRGLSAHLARAAVAVVAGGVTMYESCALGAAVVAVPVVAAQRSAIAAACRMGAVVNAATSRGVSAARIAAATADLLSRPAKARRLGRQARRLVDGRGAARVADRLRALLDDAGTGGWRHAA